MILLIQSLLLSVATSLTPSANDRVIIEDVRIVFNRQGPQMEVQQFVILGLREAVKQREQRAFRVELPVGIESAEVMGNEQSGDLVLLERGHLSVDIPADTTRYMFSIRYYLPIADGAVEFEQQFPFPVQHAEGLSTWTMDGAALRGKGFEDAEEQELSNGESALFVVSPGLRDGRLKIELSGLKAAPGRVLSILSLLLSAGVLLSGLFIWLRRGRGPATSTEGERG